MMRRECELIADASAAACLHFFHSPYVTYPQKLLLQVHWPDTGLGSPSPCPFCLGCSAARLQMLLEGFLVCCPSHFGSTSGTSAAGGPFANILSYLEQTQFSVRSLLCAPSPRSPGSSWAAVTLQLGCLQCLGCLFLTSTARQ